ncbi:L-threonine kinase [Streptococcus rupicaprae]|uniref:L-threonine kinase n=1 Tax=Streptococcus rupicaprae TaxID=759619 RepID=A0ABV2FF09_9STRE
MSWVKASCPASCGELFQCTDGQKEYLLSYGIDRGSWVDIGSTETFEEEFPEKMTRVLKRRFPSLSVPMNYGRTVPVGKGYSSSTADLVACLQAVSVTIGEPLTAEQLTRWCAEIEPTDSVAFADWTVIDPLTGEVIYQTDWKPKLFVYVLEPEQLIETISLPRMTIDSAYPWKDSINLLEVFKQACQLQDVQLLGQVASQSALLNNQRLPKPYLPELLELAKGHAALGVNVAHSGSVVGILLTKEALPNLPRLEQALKDGPIGDYYGKRYLAQLCYEGVTWRKECE